MTKDAFFAYMMKGTESDREVDTPIIDPVNELYNRPISFLEMMRTNDYNQWVHFYENDDKFESVCNNLFKHLPRLKRFQGIITPDFSLYRDMPLAMQVWNTYGGKALGHWWRSKGLNMLPNVRYSGKRTASFFCNNISAHTTAYIDSHEHLKDLINRTFIKRWLEFVIDYLEFLYTKAYGRVTDDVFGCDIETGTMIVYLLMNCMKCDVCPVRNERHTSFYATRWTGRIILPPNDAQLKHIFRNDIGHLTDTPTNRQLLYDLANDKAKYIGTDKWGNKWNIRVNDGLQYWVSHQNNVINDGGRNLIHRLWDSETGLKHNPKSC